MFAIFRVLFALGSVIAVSVAAWFSIADSKPDAPKSWEQITPGLAEHGGPYVFDKEDYRRREKWGQVAGMACDALCGDHRRDWTPHRVSVEPELQTAKPNSEIAMRVTRSESGRDDPGATITLLGLGLFPDQVIPFKAGARQEIDMRLKLPATLPAGRHVFAV